MEEYYIYPTRTQDSNTINIHNDYEGLYQEVYVKIVYTDKRKIYRVDRFSKMSQFIEYIKISAFNDFLINQDTKDIEIVDANINNNIIYSDSQAEERPRLEPSNEIFQEKYKNLSCTPIFYIRIVDRLINNENV
jgi:hypothetical protein